MDITSAVLSIWLIITAFLLGCWVGRQRQRRTLEGTTLLLRCAKDRLEQLSYERIEGGLVQSADLGSIARDA
jgi:hypothetical protein